MQNRVMQALALALSLSASSAWATWTLVGDKYTDGDYSFSVYESSNVSGGGKVLFGVTKATTDLRDLDLTSFYEDTGLRVVEIHEYTKLGNIQYVTGFVGPDVVRINNYGLCCDTPNNKYPFAKIHVSADLEYLGSSACSGLPQMVDFYPLNMEKLTYCGSAFDQSSIRGDIRMPILTTLGGNFCRIYNGTAGITSIYAPNVTEVGGTALSKQTLLTNVVFSSGLTKIGANAFPNCSALESFYPRTAPLLTSIGNNAFQYCTKLTGSFSFPVCESVGDNAFCGCTGLQDLTLSSEMQTIGSYAFYNCSAVTNFTPTVYPKLKGTVGTYAFVGCSIRAAFDLGGATAIGDSAFQSVPVLEVVCTNMAQIGADAFNGCTAMTNFVAANTLKAINARAFYGCSNLETFEPFLPPGMTSFGYAAFSSCTKLRTPLVWDNPDMTEMPVYGFDHCSSITSVTIRSYLSALPGSAFNFLRDGLEFYWDVEAPTTIAIPNGGEKGYRFYVTRSKIGQGWATLAADETYGHDLEQEKSDPYWPGRRTFGCLYNRTLVASGCKLWLICNPPPGMVFFLQ